MKSSLEVGNPKGLDDHSVLSKEGLDNQSLFSNQGLWVFGYGSLMWRPEFSYEYRVKGRCAGLQRSFCVRSVHHRGSYAQPGLVLGLDRGGACDGVLFYVPSPQAIQTLSYLRKREQVTRVYREVYMPVELLDGSGRVCRALCYVADRGHKQYIGTLSVQRKADIIRRCVGQSGKNIDYFLSTLRHMDELGFYDAELKRILALTGCAYRL
ncbi:MAG: gamma-glutamylcyclotransferase [Rhodomicrobiaceae bacterium]